ncbi:MAG TPA: RNA-binding protein [Anaerolineae bacterium]|nr:RNA-binding protein [Anaerolineae bacterium]
MNKRLYVGSLSYDTTDQGLRDLFVTAGAVASAEVIIDRYSQRSKGFGFVEMETAEGAEKAVSQFNGTNLDGREISVAEARPRAERREGGGSSDRGGRFDRNDRW